MTLKMPDGVIISNVKIDHNIPNFKTESLNLKQKTKSRGLHRLEGSLDIDIENLRQQKAWQSFLLKCQGSLNKFELDLPLHFKSTGITNPTLTKAASVGDTVLNVGSFVGTLYEGSCFTILNDSKTYFITEDATSGQTLKVFPALRQAQLAGSPVNFLTPVVTVRFDDDTQSISYDEQGLILSASIEFTEAL